MPRFMIHSQMLSTFAHKRQTVGSGLFTREVIDFVAIEGTRLAPSVVPVVDVR